MATKKIKVKVKKKKLKIKNILILLLFIIILIGIFIYIIKLPIKNIYITGNNLVKDKEIITLCGLENYPSFLKTYFTDFKSKIKQNKYIKNVKVKRNLLGKIYIEIEEYKPLFIYQNKLVLSSKEQVSNNYNVDYVPYITNDLGDIYSKLIERFSEVDDDILYKISHIEYTPNEVDKERFILYMIDSNYVYITLSKIDKINKYNSIVNELEDTKGIIYLDSGDYVEIKG